MGNKIGVPIKASSIYNKPTLKELEKKFEINKEKKQLLKQQLKEKLDSVLSKAKNRNEITNALLQSKIDILWRTNKENFLYGVTYIDHYSKTVFNGSELGKEYSAAAVREIYNKQVTEVRSEQIAPATRISELPQSITESNKENLLDELTGRSSAFDNQLPYQLRKKRKRNQRKI